MQSKPNIGRSYVEHLRGDYVGIEGHAAPYAKL